MRFARPASAVRPMLALFALCLISACSDDDPASPQAPGAPTNVAATANGATGVRVTWTAVSGADGYTLQRAAGATGTFAQIATPASSAVSYDDNGLTAGTTYRYRLYATRGSQQSAASSEASVTLAVAGPKLRVVTGSIATNQTWYADSTYVLSGFVKVQSPAKLTIQAGTKIVG